MKPWIHENLGRYVRISRILEQVALQLARKQVISQRLNFQSLVPSHFRACPRRTTTKVLTPLQKRQRKRKGTAFITAPVYNSSSIWSMYLELDRHVSTSARFPCLRNRVFFSPRPRNTQITEARSNACVPREPIGETGRSLCIVSSSLSSSTLP